MLFSRFENMKKEQDEEAAKRVAEERSKRAANDQQSASNGHDKVKPQEVPPVSKQAVREPSPPPVPRPETPPAQMSHPTIYENLGHQFENQRPATYEEKKEEPNQFIGGVNVSSLLRQRKASSSSSKNEEDDEWADDRQSYNEQQQQPARRSPSPTPEVQSSNPNEGIRCIAHYSYQKSNEIHLVRFHLLSYFSGRG